MRVLRSVLGSIVLLGLAACGEDDAPSSRPMPPPEQWGTAAPTSAPAAPSSGFAPYEGADPFRPSAGRPLRRPTPAPTSVSSTTASDASVPSRDLEAEVKRAFGDPGACIPRSAGVPESLTVTVQVRLTAFGSVSSASVSAPGIEASALDCLRRRAEALRIAAPVSGAPRSVSASITLARAPL